MVINLEKTVNFSQELLEQISNRIKELREDSDIKQEDIARILNVTRSTYVNWENAENFLPLDTLDKIATYFNVSLDYLLGLSPKKKTHNKYNNISWETIHKNLKTLRKENHYTIAYLAKICNMSQANYFNVEKGKYPLRIYYLVKILNLYNQSADEFTGKVIIKKQEIN